MSDRLPFEIVKKLQNLTSWKMLYSKLGTPNKPAAERTDAEIALIKSQYDLS